MSRSLIKLQRTALRVQKLAFEWAGWSRQTYLQDRVDEYRRMWEQLAARQDGTFTELASDLWQIDVGARRVRILNHELEFDNPVTLGLAGRKPVVHRLLGAAGIAVPEHAVFALDQLDVARRFVERHPQGCVIKPAGGYGGKGITTHVQEPGEVRRAALLSSLYGTELLVEAMIPGESYRLLVLEGKLISAVCRRGPRLQGNGVSTVRRLLDVENVRRRAVRLPPLDVDRDCLFTLRYQGMTPESRPEQGRVIIIKSIDDPVRKSVEVRTVYTHAADDVICESIRQDAEAAARLVRSDFLGVDVITPDPSLPLRESGGAINEVNTTPALHHHYDASRQAFPEVAVVVLQALLKRRAAVTTR